MPKRKGDFTRSTCECDFCTSVHAAVDEWDRLVPTTNLQFRMKQAVHKIEWRLLPEPPVRKSIKEGPTEDNTMALIRKTA